MNFKYIKNYVPNETATMLLYDTIGSDGSGNGIGGAQFANELMFLESIGTKACDIRINSGGGSVVDGFAMVAAILNTSMVCNTYNDGLAASMAGVVWQAGQKRYMKDYAIFMAHNPNMDNPTDKDNEILQLMKDSLIKIFQKRACIDPENMASIMDKETWLDSSSCLEMGFCDEVIHTAERVELDKTMPVNRLALIYNSIIIENNMKENLIKALSLAQNSTEAEVISAISALKVKAEAEPDGDEMDRLKAENAELKKKVAEMESAMNASAEATAEAVVDAAIASGKIKAESKPNWLNIAKGNIEAAKAAILELPTVKNAAVIVTKPAEIKNESKLAPGETKTYEDWCKKENTAEFEKIQKEQPERFTAIANAFYAK